jgi:hypothetical protein
MRDPLTIPVMRVEFTFPNGDVFERDYTIATASEAPAFLRPGGGDTAPPDWLDNPRREWSHPQDPVTFRGDVKPGREAEANAALRASTAEPGDGGSAT